LKTNAAWQESESLDFRKSIVRFITIGSAIVNQNHEEVFGVLLWHPSALWDNPNQ